MKLTASEIGALLPLLRPGVKIEIVLHADEEHEAAPLDGGEQPVRKKRARARWTPEARAAAGARMVAGRRKKREAVEEETPAVGQVFEPDAVAAPPPAPLPEAKAFTIQAFGKGGTPDQRQVALLRAETDRMRQQKAGGNQ